MSIYNIISKNTITSPFLQFTKEQDIISSQINYIFKNYLVKNTNNKTVIENLIKIKPIINSNNIIYNNEKIILFNFIELFLYENSVNNEILIKVLHPLNKEYLTIINCIYENYTDFLHVMYNWKRVFNKFNGVEFQYPLNELNLLKQEILTGKITKDKIIIPFHEHFKKYLNKFSDLLNKNIDDYQLTINFYSTDISRIFSFTIIFYDGKNEHILFDNIDVEKANIDQFLKQLFFYGNIQ